MRLTAIVPGHLWAVESVLTNLVAESIDRVDWATQQYQRLTDIGSGLRRNMLYDSYRDAPVDQYVKHNLIPQLEQACAVRFDQPENYNYQIWLDEPGFRPRMHTDGRKPAALQAYWQPSNNANLGTAFYSTAKPASILHYFASEPNTGYFMLNDHAPWPELWHDMLTPVPDNTLRLSLYFSFGTYRKTP